MSDILVGWDRPDLWPIFYPSREEERRQYRREYYLRRKKNYEDKLASESTMVTDAPYHQSGQRYKRDFEQMDTGPPGVNRFPPAKQARIENMTNGNTLSKYHEVDVAYRRRKAPRRIKRKVLAQKARWLYQAISDAPKNQYIRQGGQEISWTQGTLSGAGTANQAFSYCLMYPYNGAAGTTIPNDDISLMWTQWYTNATQNPTAAGLVAGSGAPISTAPTSYKMHFIECIMETELTAAAANGTNCVVSLYDIYFRHGADFQEANLNTLLVEQSGQLATGTWTLNRYSATPFDFGGFCSNVLITQKREILLAPGETCQLVMKDRKTHTISGEQLLSKSQMGGAGTDLAWGGLTKGYLICVTGMPIDNAGTANISAGTLIIANTKKYTFKVTGGNVLGSTTVT